MNEKYFSISKRCGRNHQNKFCLRPLKWTNVPGELSPLKHSIKIYRNSGEFQCHFLDCKKYSQIKQISDSILFLPHASHTHFLVIFSVIFCIAKNTVKLSRKATRYYFFHTRVILIPILQSIF